MAPMGQIYPQNNLPKIRVRIIKSTRPISAIAIGAPSWVTSPKMMSCNCMGNIGANIKKPIVVDMMRKMVPIFLLNQSLLKRYAKSSNVIAA